MSKNSVIQIKCIFLLLLYIFSNSPAILFHHHERPKQNKEQHFSFSDHTFEQGQQLKIAEEKCFLCQHHTLSTHAIAEAGEYFIGIVSPADYLLKSDFFFSRTAEKGSSRAPPMV